MHLNLSGVAFVTGAGGSIGQACILQFAREGVQRLVGLDLSLECLKTTESLLLKEFPNAQFLPLQVDLGVEREVDEAFEKVLRVFGRIDYAVNNAAVPGPFRPTAENTLADLDKVLAVNVKGIWLCERAEVRLMEKQDPPPSQAKDFRLRARDSRGSIINVNSILGVVAMPENSLYTVSKHAILGLTKTDALDYAKLGVRVNSVCPGFVDTPLMTPDIRDFLKPNIDKTPMRRLALPEEIADAVVFLASSRSSYMTGATMIVDGGYTIH
ncbi:hypothetical protein ASPVEDRAFT_154040 [Aspergillus versicolor CBS 583.65]|uniref:Uncharacterized protein n=1 Tax=Aspergillus versicolor CBS 583.65 TaxID=1036611 RepID=A0A1L9PWT5_ASPVE|nr:uncharacterized protein ASPVEDRAFT_154040 [Aspergillus versicolor CBS 583.65]OJJ05923.1 hypothetical protein ASPVEDRAFT_154040 [Aspergillus versicolor CBS 583.65]